MTGRDLPAAHAACQAGLFPVVARSLEEALSLLRDVILDRLAASGNALEIMALMEPAAMPVFKDSPVLLADLGGAPDLAGDDAVNRLFLAIGRSDPDVLVAPSLTSPSALSFALRLANTGHPVYAAMAAGSTAAAAERLLSLGLAAGQECRVSGMIVCTADGRRILARPDFARAGAELEEV